MRDDERERLCGPFKQQKWKRCKQRMDSSFHNALYFFPKMFQMIWNVEIQTISMNCDTEKLSFWKGLNREYLTWAKEIGRLLVTAGKALELLHLWQPRGRAGVRILSRLGVTGCKCDGFSGVKEVIGRDVWDVGVG